MGEVKNYSEEQMMSLIHAESPFHWITDNHLQLGAGPWTLKDHEYQLDWLDCHAPEQCFIKGAQIGASEINVLKTLHGHIFGEYKQGSLYLFPTRDDVGDFAQTRFDPLIEQNPFIGAYVRGTDRKGVKKVGRGILYLRGARATRTIGGTKKSSTQLKSISVDRVVFDEFDEMEESMIELAQYRVAHSLKKELIYLGTPTIPDYGMDRMYCVTPDTKILNTELEWIRAGDLKLEDSVIGFDEDKPGDSKVRKYHTTRVTDLTRLELPCYKLTMEDGTSVTCSAEHRWLTNSSSNIRWKHTKNFKVGDTIRSIGKWKTNNSFDAGWLAGIFDGEGCLGSYLLKSGGYSRQLVVTQRQTVVLEKIKKLLDLYNFSYTERIDKFDIATVWIKGGLPEILRFLGSIRPLRLLEKASRLWEDRAVGNDAGCTKNLKIIYIEDVGIKEVVTVGTQHKTFIAEGMLSHNSNSDQRVWMLECPSCGKEASLDLEFPKSIRRRLDGTAYRACIFCQAEVHPGKGRWVAQVPSKSKDLVGWWISQLNSAYVDPTYILNKYEDPPFGDLSEVMNSTLGRAYIPAENRLSHADVYACCGNDPMVLKHDGPTCMGVDVGSVLHVVIAQRKTRKTMKVLWMGRVDSFNDLHDLARDFNVKSAVLDLFPEKRKVVEFQKSENYSVFGCNYVETKTGQIAWDESDRIIKGNRTEICDMSHELVSSSGWLELPRRSMELDQFTKEVCNIAKVLDEDTNTGSRTYRYKKLGSDHYRHALNYCLLASERVGTVSDSKLINRFFKSRRRRTWMTA